MCRAVTCKTCGKTTWAGCGQHINEVKRTVPAGQWCPGHDNDTKQKDTRQPATGGAFARLFGR